MPASVTTESSLSQYTSALFEINSVEQVVEEESLRLSPEENNNNSTQTALITRATPEDGSQVITGGDSLFSTERRKRLFCAREK